MNEIYLLHDLTQQEAEQLANRLPGKINAFSAGPDVKHCVGCFGCWLKTPGQCVIHDRAEITPVLIADSREMLIVSRLTYGGYSPDVKTVMDRSIGYMLPFFQIVHNEMHHSMRYSGSPRLRVCFYGEDITEKEQALGKRLVAANALNFRTEDYSVEFFGTVRALTEGIS